MKALHIIGSINKESGGPARSSQGLVAALEQCGVEAWLVVFNKNDKPWVNGVVHFKAFERSNYWGRKKELWQFVDQMKPAVIHVHGIWGSVSHLACVVARQKKIPYLLAPRGMLEPWSLTQKKWKKKLALWLYQRRDLQKAIALHATAESEADQFRKLGFTQKIVVSPNGINVPKQLSPHSCRADEKKVILFVSRIHPKKGLIMLIAAISQLKKKNLFDGWHIEYAGPDENDHHKEVKKSIAFFNLQNDFTYLGDLDDESKWDAYTRATLFVLPTYSENFGIVIAEALYAGIPVITTKGTPWGELETERCGKWVEIGVEALTEALRVMISLSDEERQQKGIRGRNLVSKKYTWDSIGLKMLDTYKAL